MTKEKDFKDLVRARMAKTGESYTSARAQMRIGALNQPASPRVRTTETAALAAALAGLGVRHPGSGKPLGESWLFGTGGGIGLAYFVFEYRLGPAETWISLYLGARINPHIQRAAPGMGKDAEFLDVACTRAGVPFEVLHSSSAKAAEKQLRAALASGRQVIATVDEALLGHGLPRRLVGTSPLGVGITLTDDVPALIGLGPQPRPTTWDEIGRLRAAIKSAKHRLLVLDVPKGRRDLAAAARAGISETCRGLLEPPTTNFGLPALARWADLVTDARDKKGWPTLFRDGTRLAQALKWVAHWTVGPGSDGSFLRALYADFLDEASELLGTAPLRKVAERYRGLATAWAELAQAVLPRAVPQLEPICSLLAWQRCLLERHGGAAAEMSEVDEDLARVDRELAAAAIAPDEAKEIARELGQRLRQLHQQEKEAARALAACL